MSPVVFLALLVGFYPTVVLAIALTGPHNATEIREQQERRAALRATHQGDRDVQ